MKDEEQEDFDIETYVRIAVCFILFLIVFAIESQKKDFETAYLETIVFVCPVFVAWLIGNNLFSLFINTMNKLRGLPMNFNKKDIVIFVAAVISLLIWVISAMQMLTDISFGISMIFLSAFLYSLSFFIGYKP